MDSHFSKETLRKNLEDLAKRPTASGFADGAGRAICAEARFDADHTVQRLAYLAHLSKQPTD